MRFEQLFCATAVLGEVSEGRGRGSGGDVFTIEFMSRGEGRERERERRLYNRVYKQGWRVTCLQLRVRAGVGGAASAGAHRLSQRCRGRRRDGVSDPTPRYQAGAGTPRNLSDVPKLRARSCARAGNGGQVRRCQFCHDPPPTFTWLRAPEMCERWMKLLRQGWVHVAFGRTFPTAFCLIHIYRFSLIYFAQRLDHMSE